MLTYKQFFFIFILMHSSHRTLLGVQITIPTDNAILIGISIYDDKQIYHLNLGFHTVKDESRTLNNPHRELFCTTMVRLVSVKSISPHHQSLSPGSIYKQKHHHRTKASNEQSQKHYVRQERWGESKLLLQGGQICH